MNGSEYIAYFDKTFQIFGKAVTSIKGLSIMSLSWLVALGGIEKAIIALIVVFHLDFITGCIASWIEHKKNGDKVQVYFFESAKMRLSVVKGVTYCLLIFFAYIFSVLFFDVPIKLAGSTKHFTAVELITGVCICIEVWSNIENLKRAGFDIVGKISGTAKSVWKLVREIKGNDNG